ALVDRIVVDAGVTPPHEPVVVELPVLVAMAPPPLANDVPRFVLEPNGDAIAGEAPQVLLEPVVELASPLAPQKLADRFATREELVTVSPLRVVCVGERDAIRVWSVAGVLRSLHLLACCLLCGRRQGRSLGHRATSGRRRRLGKRAALSSRSRRAATRPWS